MNAIFQKDQLVKNKLDFLPSILVAILLFFYLTSAGQILDVNYYQWLSNKDASQFFLGWLFFKNSDFFQSGLGDVAQNIGQNVLGQNPGFGYEIAGSIVYSDSIPILAIFFKIFAKILPQNFQYFGWWILLCFILQAIFAMLLLKKITPNFALQFIGSLFFIFSPILLFRIFYCQHYSLGAHFLIMAALLLYWRKNFSQMLWLLLFLVTLGIHFYIFVMLFLIYCADIAQRIFAAKNKISADIIFIVENIIPAGILILLAMWQYGYFIIGVQNASASLFGEAKMNLLALIDSDFVWSRIIPNQQQSSYMEYEGFAFLGLGIIVMLVVILSAELFSRCSLASFNRKLGDKKILPLLFIMLLLTVIALSNRISFGASELLHIKISDALSAFMGIIRSSGRMFWPAYYLIILAAIFGIIKLCENKLSPRKTALVLAAFFILQLIDISQGLAQAKMNLFLRSNEGNPFILPQDDFFENAKKYKKVIILPVSGYTDKYESIAYFAASNHLKINGGYFARYNGSALKKANAKYFAAISAGIFEPDAIYIFNEDALWKLAQKNAKKSDFLGELGHYKIMAPNY